MPTNLQQNLRHLCGSYGTAAEICRTMDINRLQFNRYLNGKACPSPRTVRKICDYYRVTEAELNLPPRQFSARVGKRRGSGARPRQRLRQASTETAPW